MSGHDLFLLIFAVLGGLAIFILGMGIMSDGLRRAAGGGLRAVLSLTSRNRVAGLGLGTLLGMVVHSSATTVMLVGFVNAGLMTLVQTVPPILGANFGTSVSMQFVSLELGSYCYVAIVAGFVLDMAGWSPRAKEIGRAILGFGLLFLGMNVMSDAIRPHRDLLAPLLAQVDGRTWPGMFKGVGLSLALTAIWQSSGATIAMCFALASANVFSGLEQVYPIILGAHIGTCATALLGSIGGTIEARRCACSHLLFNVLNVAFAIAAKPLFLSLAVASSADLVRQIANVHSFVMGISALLVLPVSGLFAGLVTVLTPSRRPPAEPSHLDDRLLKTPEHAIAAAIRELHRVAILCVQSLRLAADVMLFAQNRKTVRALRLNEQVINEIKLSMKGYLAAVARRELSRRQAVLIEYINRCMADIERIGDHIDEIGELSLKRQGDPDALFDPESTSGLFDLYGTAMEVVRRVVDSLAPEETDFREKSEVILRSAAVFESKSEELKDLYSSKLAHDDYSPTAGVFFMEYLSALERIVKHSVTIAGAIGQPDFRIKEKKLDRQVSEAPPRRTPELVDPKELLAKLDE